MMMSACLMVSLVLARIIASSDAPATANSDWLIVDAIRQIADVDGDHAARRPSRAPRRPARCSSCRRRPACGRRAPPAGRSAAATSSRASPWRASRDPSPPAWRSADPRPPRGTASAARRRSAMSKYGAAIRPTSRSTCCAVVERGRRHDAAREAEFEPRRIGARVGLAADVLEREVEAPNISSQFRRSSISSISTELMPVANAPPIRPPMLVPAATSIGM